MTSQTAALLLLPEAALQHIMELAICDRSYAVRLVCRQLQEAADAAVVQLSFHPYAFEFAAAAAPRWPRLQRLEFSSWSRVQQWSFYPDGHRLALLRVVLKAAEDHWPQLQQLSFSTTASAWHPNYMDVLTSCLRNRLTALALGAGPNASHNARVASLLPAHFSRLQSLHWGCGRVNTAVFEQLGLLTALRDLRLEGTLPEKDAHMYNAWTGPQHGYASMLPLSALVGLTMLGLGDSAAGNSFHGVKDIGEALSVLTQLELLNVQPLYLATAASLLPCVAPLTRLRSLRVGDSSQWANVAASSSSKTYASLEPLRQLTGLAVLELPCATLGNQEVQLLSKLVLLARLCMLHIAVGAACAPCTLPALQHLSVDRCAFAMVPLAHLMPQLQELICREPWPVDQLHSLNGHPTLTRIELGYEADDLPAEVAACLATLPNH